MVDIIYRFEPKARRSNPLPGTPAEARLQLEAGNDRFTALLAAAKQSSENLAERVCAAATLLASAEESPESLRHGIRTAPGLWRLLLSRSGLHQCFLRVLFFFAAGVSQ